QSRKKAGFWPENFCFCFSSSLSRRMKTVQNEAAVMKERDYYLLQVNDALFPIGGYSHSQGLETYIQKGLVHDEKSAEEYIRNRLRWSLAYTDLLAVRLAYEYAKQEELEKL